MSRSALQPSQQKLAEKLTILNDRGVGMLTRIYNIKKAFEKGLALRLAAVEAVQITEDSGLVEDHHC